MKVLRRTTQRNVELARDFYRNMDLNEMLENNEIFWIDDEKCYECTNRKNYTSETVFRLDVEELTEIKVVVTDGHYETVAIGKNGKTYHVSL